MTSPLAHRLSFAIAPPAADLDRTISVGWSIDAPPGSGSAFFELLPDASANLVVRVTDSSCRMVLLGPATEKATIELAGGAQYFGLRFCAGGAPAWADASARELVDGRAELTSLRGESRDALGERLRALPDLPARLRLVEDLVRQAPPLVRDPRCRRAALLVEQSLGQVRIQEVADGIGLHVRSLERLFLDHLGLGPKRLARIVRLRWLMARLRLGGFESLAALACDCGYSDQSHMIRDFKELIGRLPGDEEPSRPRRLGGPDETRVVHRYRP